MEAICDRVEKENSSLTLLAAMMVVSVKIAAVQEVSISSLDITFSAAPPHLATDSSAVAPCCFMFSFGGHECLAVPAPDGRLMVYRVISNISELRREALSTIRSDLVADSRQESRTSLPIRMSSCDDCDDQSFDGRRSSRRFSISSSRKENHEPQKRKKHSRRSKSQRRKKAQHNFCGVQEAPSAAQPIEVQHSIANPPQLLKSFRPTPQANVCLMLEQESDHPEPTRDTALRMAGVEDLPMTGVLTTTPTTTPTTTCVIPVGLPPPPPHGDTCGATETGATETGDQMRGKFEHLKGEFVKMINWVRGKRQDVLPMTVSTPSTVEKSRDRTFIPTTCGATETGATETGGEMLRKFEHWLKGKQEEASQRGRVAAMINWATGKRQHIGALDGMENCNIIMPLRQTEKEKLKTFHPTLDGLYCLDDDHYAGFDQNGDGWEGFNTDRLTDAIKAAGAVCPKSFEVFAHAGYHKAAIWCHLREKLFLFAKPRIEDKDYDVRLWRYDPSKFPDTKFPDTLDSRNFICLGKIGAELFLGLTWWGHGCFTGVCGRKEELVNALCKCELITNAAIRKGATVPGKFLPIENDVNLSRLRNFRDLSQSGCCCSIHYQSPDCVIEYPRAFDEEENQRYYWLLGPTPDWNPPPKSLSQKCLDAISDCDLA